jgi:hypothetical protein
VYNQGEVRSLRSLGAFGEPSESLRSRSLLSLPRREKEMEEKETRMGEETSGRKCRCPARPLASLFTANNGGGMFAFPRINASDGKIHWIFHVSLSHFCGSHAGHFGRMKKLPGSQVDYCPRAHSRLTNGKQSNFHTLRARLILALLTCRNRNEQ